MNATEPVRVADDRSLVVRAVWFVLIGWWATGIWLSVAWFLNLLIVTIPLGIKMINMVPMVLSLKSPTREFVSETGTGTVHSREQRTVLVRAVWFVLIGWWASAVWMAIAYGLTVSILGIPIAIWMYGKLPLVVSLYRY
ncbi:YccF domain-containing protein [Halorubrum sp. DTA98]|uniref:YccF domain-containing protein n=1 Tax=Halorubrum sp. DTA98 TaxID=3402163 RepID=UPI003AAF9EDA